MSDTQDLHHRIAAGLSRVGLVLRHRTQAVAGAHGLTPLQAQALGVLRGRAAGLRVGELARELAVTDATTSDAVSALAGKKLVHKAGDPDEHRAVRLVLTAAGRRVAEETSVWPDFLRESVATLPSGEAVAFLRVLIGLIRDLERRGDIPLTRMCVSCRFFGPDRHPGAARPHHCDFIDAPIGGVDVRIDCLDFEAAPAVDRERGWAALVGGAD